MEKQKEVQYEWLEISSIIVIAAILTSIIAIVT